MEINGELHIKGGPACERCKGTGKYTYFVGGGDTCIACYGTGVKPLSEWTADECAEWLRDHNPTKGCLTICPATVPDTWGVIFEYWSHEGFEILSRPDGNDFWGQGKTLTEALRAAVAAVAERKGDA